MSLVNVINMTVLDNPSFFKNPFQFEITFECLQNLGDDLEWKVVYVGSAEDSSLDQTLEEVLVGPIPVGVNKFVLQAEAPDHTSIPENDILGVTVILVTCSFQEQEFGRIGYYVNNEYSEPFDPEVGPPKPLDITKIKRQILADKPRVTRFPIDWGDSSPPNQTADQNPTEELSNSAVIENSDMEVENSTGMTDDILGASQSLGPSVTAQSDIDMVA